MEEGEELIELRLPKTKIIEGAELDRLVRKLMREDGYSKGIEDVVQAILARFLDTDMQPEDFREHDISCVSMEKEASFGTEARKERITQTLTYNALALKGVYNLELRLEHDIMSLVLAYVNERNKILADLYANERIVCLQVEHMKESVKTQLGDVIYNPETGKAEVNMIDLRSLVLQEMQDRLRRIRALETVFHLGGGKD